jgi:hypothetical protein
VASRGNWIGVLVVQNNGSTSHLSQTQLLDYKLILLGLEADATDEMVREALAKVCNQITPMARPWNCSLIAMEQGLGKLRASGRNKSLNRKINFWASNFMRFDETGWFHQNAYRFERTPERRRGASGAGEAAGGEDQHAPILGRRGAIQAHQRQFITRE